MARIFDFNKTDTENEKAAYPNTLDGIKSRILDGGLYAEFEDSKKFVKVKVHAHLGGSDYMSSAPSTLRWLRENSRKVERRGVVEIFYVPTTGD